MKQPRRLVRTHEKGQVTLLADVRLALDQIGQLLRDQGVSLDDLIESSRDIRGDLLAQLGSPASAQEPSP